MKTQGFTLIETFIPWGIEAVVLGGSENRSNEGRLPILDLPCGHFARKVGCFAASQAVTTVPLPPNCICSTASESLRC